MKVKRLKIKNVGMVADETVEFDKPLVLFYGEIRNGKTTILNSVKWALGASFPTDIIRHGEKEASATLEFDGGSVGRSWYRNKDGEVAARPVTFIRDGKPVGRPMDEIRKFLNPFLLDQDHLRNMTELERKKFFTELFSIDTTSADAAITKADQRAKELRIKIKTVGEIDVTPVERIETSAVKAEMDAILTAHEANARTWQAEIDRQETAYREALNKVTSENAAAVSFNSNVQRQTDKKVALMNRIAELETELKVRKDELNQTDLWLTANPAKHQAPMPNAPDVSDLRSKMASTPDVSAQQAKLNEAAAVEVRYQQYQSNLARQKAKDADEKELSDLDALMRTLRQSKISALKTVSESSGIKGLEFDEDGNFIYDGTSAGMLSTSQLMKLSSDLSALYPDGFGIELLDRGESLGKSIFQFIERAKREDKTILASIVGEKPAVIPDDIGVWVVEGGKVKP